MTVKSVRDELAHRLETIGGLRVYRQPPDTPPELPAAIIQPGEPLAEYDRVAGAADVSYRFSVLLLARSADTAQAWEEVAACVNPAGDRSVKRAVEGAPAVNADWFRVVRAGAAVPVTCCRVPCWGVTFLIEAYASG